MRKLRSVLCVILTIVMFACSTVQIYAADISMDSTASSTNVNTIISENFGYMLDSVIRRSEAYGIDAEKFDDFTILNPVVFNSIEEEDDNSASVTHFPVADETGTICLIFDVIMTENGYTTSIGADFAPLLNAVYANESTSVVLVQDEYSFYAISDTACYSQSGNAIDSMDALERAVMSNTYVVESMMPSSLAVNSEYSLLAENSYAHCVEERAELRSSAVTGTSSLSNYPIVDQKVDGTQYGLCWAATVASMVQFEKPSVYGDLTAQNVADYMRIDYDEGGTNSESKEALEHYLGGRYVPTIKNDVLTQEQIKMAIDNIDPAYMQCRRPNGFLRYKYHAVAMIGYDFTSNYTRIEIMDPAYECFKYCTMGSDGDWTFAFGSYTYTWIKTIRLLYSS